MILQTFFRGVNDCSGAASCLGGLRAGSLAVAPMADRCKLANKCAAGGPNGCRGPNGSRRSFDTMSRISLKRLPPRVPRRRTWGARCCSGACCRADCEVISTPARSPRRRTWGACGVAPALQAAAAGCGFHDNCSGRFRGVATVCGARSWAAFCRAEAPRAASRLPTAGSLRNPPVVQASDAETLS